MPLLVLFDGRPVKRRHRVGQGLRLIFANRSPGEPAESVVVTQQEWLRHGHIQFFPKSQMPNVRALARQFEI
jgi:hypothetical protein